MKRYDCPDCGRALRACRLHQVRTCRGCSAIWIITTLHGPVKIGSTRVCFQCKRKANAEQGPLEMHGKGAFHRECYHERILQRFFWEPGDLIRGGEPEQK